MNSTVVQTQKIRHDLTSVVGGLKASLETLAKDPKSTEALLKLTLEKLNGILSRFEKGNEK